MKTHMLSLACLAACGGPLHANNIHVSNVQRVGLNAANHTYQVQFDLSWESSWRSSTLESNAGYFREDVNKGETANYGGSENDRDPVLVKISVPRPTSTTALP